MKCIKCQAEIPDNSKFCNLCGVSQESKRTPKHKTKSRGNGQGTVYKLPSGKWCAEVTLGYDGDRRLKRTKSGFKTKKEALDYIPTLKHAKPANRKVITLETLWQSLSKSSMVKVSKSKQTHFKTAHNKINDILYDEINTLTIDNLQDVVDDKAPTYYPAKDIKTLLSHLYKRAVAEGVVSTNLAEYIELPSLEEKEQSAFTEEELLKLWKDYGNGNKFTGYLLLMIYSGMMPGELFRAEKAMINWDEQCIEGCGLKTKKRKSTPIVIADMMIPVLKDLCQYSQTDKILNVRREVFYDQYKETLQRCGCRPLRPYSCRHTTATALALGNIAPSVIQEVMRHTKFSTTQKYIHVDTSPMLNAVNEILK